MGLFFNKAHPPGTEVLRARDSARSRRKGMVALLVTLAMVWLALPLSENSWLFGILMLFSGIYAYDGLSAPNASEFMLLDATGCRLVAVIEDDSGRRETPVPFADIAEVVIEREQIREEDGYSGIEKLAHTLIVRTRSGERIVVADPFTTEPAVLDSLEAVALRDRLKAMIGPATAGGATMQGA